MAFLKAQAVEKLEARKLALQTGLWANDGLNDDKGSRAQALEDLDTKFNEAIALVYAGAKELKEKEDLHRFTEEDEQNPFLAPAIRATRGLDKFLDEDERKVAQAAIGDDREGLDQT